MFFYLSFLRPPPLQAAPYGSILITPQISNDLRTEHFPGSQDLFYSWMLESPNQLGLGGTATKPAKLTTWRVSNAYKEIPVPVPAGVREGQSWRLVLTGRTQAPGKPHPECIDLGSRDVGNDSFPVLSMPVLFSARGLKAAQAQKQEMIERIYVLPTLKQGGTDAERSNQLKILRFKEQTSFDLDKKIWDSGIGLSSWLARLKNDDSLVAQNPVCRKLHDALFSEQPRNILELGTGIGMVSVALAVLRSTSTVANKPLNYILASDVASAMPLLEQNISNNESYYLSTKPKAITLDWDDEELPEEAQKFESLDAIVMADVTYNSSSFPSLCGTLSRLVRLHTEPPLIILGYKERDEAERNFWSMIADAGFEFEKVGECKGAGGAPVEIWVGTHSNIPPVKT